MLQRTLNSLSAVVIVIFMVAIGYIFGKLGYIKHEHKKLLTKLIINVGMPSLVVNTMFEKLDFSLLPNPWLLFLLPLIGTIISLIMSSILTRILRSDVKRKGGFIVMCAFSNSVFVGLPMNTGLFGDSAIPYVMSFYVINTTLFWTIGNYLIHQSGDREERSQVRFKNMKKLLSPPLIALAISLPLAILGVKLPNPVIRLASYMGNTVTPLALFYIGYTLYEYGIKSMKLDKHMISVVIMRFCFAPVVMIILCRLFRVEGMAAGVLIIESAMPVMTQAVVLAGEHNADEAFLSGGMCVTTLSCFIVVPLLMLLMQLMGIV